MFLGVDLGTSSIKVLLADKDGRLLGSESEKYPIFFPEIGYSEQNPIDWWNAFCSVIKKLGTRFDLSAVEGISFSGQMHGLVALDSDNNVIRPAILWNDSRTIAECEYLNNTIGKHNLVDWTGNMALTGFTAPKVLWLRDHEPENFAKISKIMMPKDFLAYKLTSVFASDVTDNSGTLYFDVENKCWSEPMLDILGIKKSQLPAIYESVDVVGTVQPSVADDLGLSDKTRVIIGGGDQAMGALGTATTKSEQVSISLGTSGVVFINADSYKKDKDASLHNFCHANGRYHLMGVTLSCAGGATWWVENILKMTDYTMAYDGINALDIDDTLFLPYLMGERSPINDPLAKGGFYGLSLGCTQKQMTKAVLEGICFSLKDCLLVANEMGIHPVSARVIGGASKSAELLQLLSDILGIEIKTINTAEGGGLGAIMLAMTACGRFKDIDSACTALVRDLKTFRPNADKTEQYTAKFAKFKALYNAVRK